MRVGQMFQVHGILRRFLWVTSKPQRAESQLAPLPTGGWLIRQIPLWRPAGAAPPGEDHAEDLFGLVDLQLRSSGSRGAGSGDALPGRVELEPVKGTDQATVAHRATNRGSHMRAQVRTERACHTDATFVVAPDDDLLAHPGPLDQLLSQQVLAFCDEIPPLGERGQLADDSERPSLGIRCHIARSACQAVRPVPLSVSRVRSRFKMVIPQ